MLPSISIIDLPDDTERSFRRRYVKVGDYVIKLKGVDPEKLKACMVEMFEALEPGESEFRERFRKVTRACV